MGATRDAVGIIGSVLRSLMSVLTGGEAEGTQEHNPPDWQTAEDKVRAARRLEILHRRIARCDRIMHDPKSLEEDGEKKSQDKFAGDIPP